MKEGVTSDVDQEGVAATARLLEIDDVLDQVGQV